jgi:hypothetical protein
MVNMITTGHQWRHQAEEVLHMKHQAVEEHGRPMGNMDGVLDLPWNIMDATQCTKKLEVNVLLKQLSSFPTEVVITFPSTKDLVTEAANQLRHILLYPTGTFAQVGNNQMLPLERLAAIFEGALQKHRRTPPAEIDDRDTPPKWRIKVSPLRVQ